MGFDVINALQDLTKVSPFIIALILFPLVSCLITGLFLSTVIFMRLRRERVAPKEIIDAIRALKAGGNTETLVRLCVRNDSSLARLVNSSLEHSSLPRAENVEVLQTLARTEVARLERGIVYLEIFVGASPLLGLVGTVSGLITIFAAVGTENADPAKISAGIAEALHTTVLGIFTAIVMLFPFTFFGKKVDVLAVELEEYSMLLLKKLYTEEVPA
jgi:biopolymer transport protein ExbB